MLVDKVLKLALLPVVCLKTLIELFFFHYCTNARIYVLKFHTAWTLPNPTRHLLECWEHVCFLCFHSFVRVIAYPKLLFDTIAVPRRGVLSYHSEDWVPVLWDVWAFSDWSQDPDLPTTAAWALGNTSNIQGLLSYITQRVQIQATQKHRTQNWTYYGSVL